MTGSSIIAASAYDIGRIEEIYQIKSGLMHETYGVHSTGGKFVLQRLHPKLSTQEILNDYVRVTQHLSENGFLAPQVIATRTNQPIHLDLENRWWRMTSFVEGRTHEQVVDVNQSEEGAFILGRFHLGMSTFAHDFESAHPLHDTDGHLQNLMKALKDQQYEHLAPLVEQPADEIIKRLAEVRVPSGLPLRVVHGDPKISNVMFLETKAVGMIDLDTCNRHTVLVDLGDAVRSWCRDGYEDEVQQFHLDRFEAILRGYARSGSNLSTSEIDYLWMAGPMITLELASRFARDVMEDNYFAYNPDVYESRRAHNLARMNSMLFLAQDMLKKRDQMKRLIQNYFPS